MFIATSIVDSFLTSGLARIARQTVAVVCGLLIGCGFDSVDAADKPDPPTRIAVLTEASLASWADLIEAGLVDKPGLELLDRRLIQRVLDEQKLSLTQATSAQSVRIGKLLGADGLIILRKEQGIDGETALVRMVAVGPGLVLAEPSYPLTGKNVSPLEAAGDVTERLLAVQPKLRVKPDDAVLVSVAGLFSAVDRGRARLVERQLTLLLTHRLMHEANVFVVERRHLEKLAFEKLLAPEPEPLATGSFVLAGSIETERNGETLHLKLQLKPPGDREPTRIDVSGPAQKQVELVEQAALDILKAIQTTPANDVWDRAAEAKYYAEHARWALDHHLLEDAQAAAESAWVLGNHDLKLREKLIRAYCLTAYQVFAGARYKQSTNAYHYGNALIDNPRALPALARALELVEDYLHFDPRPEEPLDPLDMHADTNIDYRVVSTRALLSASRVLRGCWERGVSEKQAEELATIRRQIREIVPLLQCEEIVDHRDAWVYHLMGAYAPFWYERPAEVLAAYRTVFQMKVSSDRFARILLESAFRDRDRSNDGPRSLPRSTPYLIDWNRRDPLQLQVPPESFLKELANSSNAGERAGAWVIRYFPVDYYNFQANDHHIPAMLEFLWNERKEIARGANGHWMFGPLYEIVRHADEPYRRRFFTYLMQHGSHVDISLLMSLRTAGSKKWGVCNLELPLDEQRSLWKEYIDRTKRHPNEKLNEQYFGPLNHTGWFNELNTPPQTVQTNSALTPTAPKPATPAEPSLPTLTVTRYWSPELQPELKEFWTAAGKPALNLIRFQWDGERLWCADRNARSVALSFDPVTLASESLVLPGDRSPRAVMTHVHDLAVTPTDLFAVEVPFASNLGTVQHYDRVARTWRKLDLPSAVYQLHWFAPHLYLSFHEDSGFDKNPGGSGSGVYRYDPRTGQLDLLAATRRRPAKTRLDGGEMYHPITLFRGTGGRVTAVIMRLGSREHDVYRRTADDTDWEKVGTIGTRETPREWRDRWFWFRPDTRGGLLIWDRGRYTPSSLNRLVSFGDTPATAEILLENEHSSPAELWAGTPKWRMPEQFSSPGHKDWLKTAAYDGHTLWLLSGVRDDPLLQLHVFREGQPEPAVIPVRFKLPDETKRILEVRRITPDVKVTWSLYGSSLFITPHGVAFDPVDDHGCWLLPAEDLRRAVAAAQPKGPATTTLFPSAVTLPAE